MSKVRVAGFSVSLDGFGAGIEQSLSDPRGNEEPRSFSGSFTRGASAQCAGKRVVDLSGT
jgi:hypothetical protein